MIRYPKPLQTGEIIGVTAPSSGVPNELHHILNEAIQQFEKRGFGVQVGETSWMQEKAASSSASKRAAELNCMLQDPKIAAIIPPWGGEILMEILPKIDWENVQPKWVLGYSDTSTLLFAITVMTGIATAHGTNIVDLRSDEWDPVTRKFMDVLSASDEKIVQHSSEKFQSSWNHSKNPNPYVFQLDTPTEWKTIDGAPIKMSGRLLGGCIDTIQSLVGTPYGDVRSFREKYIKGENILWYFENCEMTATDFYRALLHMHYAGWFEQSNGIVFGRTPAGEEVEGFTIVDAMERISNLADLPIVFDADIGHVPPQMTLVNGARAKLEAESGKAKLTMEFIR
ncbi:S66 family peptidase [Lederbergia citrea]|uniref:S66 family peptidase n=1 Tax=Lederbergia citrea TaxID=2833581 RepID=UPI001BC94AC2|nr:S66 peptidase family protein [Lederbergia citrea]MBS4179012.1 LD-carboxypeptidase [Lederbergia citrea]MBS4205671.1 LD-carboxypeptidase [Lederbergia citrea]